MNVQELRATPVGPRARLFRRLALQAQVRLCSLRVQGPKGWRKVALARVLPPHECTHRWSSLLLEFSTDGPVDPELLGSLRRRYRRRLQRWAQGYSQRRVSALIALFRRSLGSELHRGLCQWATALELLSSWLVQDLSLQERQQAQTELQELSRQISLGVRGLYDRILERPREPGKAQDPPLLAEVHRMLQAWDPSVQVHREGQVLRFTGLQRSQPYLVELRRCLQLLAGRSARVLAGEFVVEAAGP